MRSTTGGVFLLFFKSCRGGLFSASLLYLLVKNFDGIYKIMSPELFFVYICVYKTDGKKTLSWIKGNIKIRT